MPLLTHDRWRAWRNPLALVACSLAISAGTAALHLLPMDMIFSGATGGIDFFEMPLAKFYLFFLVAPVEILRRTGLLPYIFFFLTLGVLSACVRAMIHSRQSRLFAGPIAALQLGAFAFVLYRINAVTSPASAIIAIAFPMLYVTLLTVLRKTKMAHQNPHGTYPSHTH